MQHWAEESSFWSLSSRSWGNRGSASRNQWSHASWHWRMPCNLPTSFCRCVTVAVNSTWSVSSPLSLCPFVHFIEIRVLVEWAVCQGAQYLLDDLWEIRVLDALVPSSSSSTIRSMLFSLLLFVSCGFGFGPTTNALQSCCWSSYFPVVPCGMYSLMFSTPNLNFLTAVPPLAYVPLMLVYENHGRLEKWHVLWLRWPVLN